MNDQQFAEMRKHMVMEIVSTTVMVGERLGRYNLDPRVMDVMGRVKRHEFVPVEIQPYAYMDRPLPISRTVSSGPTCSRSVISATMKGWEMVLS